MQIFQALNRKSDQDSQYKIGNTGDVKWAQGKAVHGAFQSCGRQQSCSNQSIQIQLKKAKHHSRQTIDVRRPGRSVCIRYRNTSCGPDSPGKSAAASNPGGNFSYENVP